MGRRIAVTGGRSNYDYIQIHRVLKGILQEGDTLIHGDANGVDRIARQCAEYLEITSEAYPADWKQHGNRAGSIRNQQMLDTGLDLLVAFIGGVGTRDMTNRCRSAHVEIVKEYA